MDTDVSTIRVTDLDTLDDLRREEHDAAAANAVAASNLAEVRRWATGLAERYEVAPFATAGLSRAIAAVLEATPTLVEVDNMEAALTNLNREIAATLGLTEAADNLSASGNVSAFRSN